MITGRSTAQAARAEYQACPVRRKDSNIDSLARAKGSYGAQ